MRLLGEAEENMVKWGKRREGLSAKTVKVRNR